MLTIAQKHFVINPQFYHDDAFIKFLVLFTGLS